MARGRGRPAGRRPLEYVPPPAPQRVDWRCPGCGQVNVVYLDDILYYGDGVVKSIPACGACGTLLGTDAEEEE